MEGIQFASSVRANKFSVSSTTFFNLCVNEDTYFRIRGRTLMIEVNQNSAGSQSSFSIANVVFSANKISFRKDEYFACEPLVAFVKEPLFAFMRSFIQKDNSIVAHYRSEAFGNCDVDLLMFFDGFFSDSVYVDGTPRVKEMCCGTLKAPVKM